MQSACQNRTHGYPHGMSWHDKIAVRTMHSVVLLMLCGVTNSICTCWRWLQRRSAASFWSFQPAEIPASWHWPCPDQRCYPRPAVLPQTCDDPAPDVTRPQQRPRLPSHIVLLLAGLLHVTVGAQLRNVVTRAQEQRQPLVQRLRPDVQDAPRPVAALDHPSSCPGPPQ